MIIFIIIVRSRLKWEEGKNMGWKKIIILYIDTALIDAIKYIGKYLSYPHFLANRFFGRINYGQ